MIKFTNQKINHYGYPASGFAEMLYAAKALIKYMSIMCSVTHR